MVRVSSILNKYKNLWALDHVLAVSSWDNQIYMPHGAAVLRGEAVSTLMILRKKLFEGIAKDLKEIDRNNIDEKDSAILRILDKTAEYYEKIPEKILENEEKIVPLSIIAWSDARAKNDPSIFYTYLEKLIEIQRIKAEKLNNAHLYDALLNLYDEGLTTSLIDSLFPSLRNGIVDIIKSISDAKYYTKEHPLETMEYSIVEMDAVNRDIMKYLGLPEDKTRLDVSSHPVTFDISGDDVRITTRYDKINFKKAMYSLIHESGHAMYALAIDRGYDYTPISRDLSLSIHESQSRFWECVIGRNRNFIKFIYPLLSQKLSVVKGYSDEDLYRYFNYVKPSNIRVDADEVTYNLHIMIRYEIEKKLIEGNINVNEIPDIWNELTEEYLGIKVHNYSEGFLQDIHWSMGTFGYFPTYTMGNLITALIQKNIKKELDLDTLLIQGKLSVVKDWLKENLQKYGGLYISRDLIKKQLKEDYSVEPFLQYLRGKYVG
jgi:carboxypeptidase Taq